MTTSRKPQSPKRRRTKKGRGRPDTAEVRCPSGKIPYRSEAAGERALGEISEDPNPKRKQPVRVHPCNVCGYHHLTSQPERPRR